jgi:hypothetical protein
MNKNHQKHSPLYCSPELWAEIKFAAWVEHQSSNKWQLGLILKAIKESKEKYPEMWANYPGDTDENS